jgi:hypothetical protein
LFMSLHSSKLQKITNVYQLNVNFLSTFPQSTLVLQQALKLWRLKKD